MRSGRGRRRAGYEGFLKNPSMIGAVVLGCERHGGLVAPVDFRFAAGRAADSLPSVLSDGVTVAQRSLEPLVQVRILVGQPFASFLPPRRRRSSLLTADGVAGH